MTTTTYIARPHLMTPIDSSASDTGYDVIGPYQFPCGDQDYDTSLSESHNSHVNFAGYGQVYLVENLIDDAQHLTSQQMQDLKTGTEFFPQPTNGFVLTAIAQRLVVVYSCDFPVIFTASQGDGGSLSVTGPAGTQITTRVPSDQAPQVNQWALLFGYPEAWPDGTDPSTEATLTVHEWWVETDMDLEKLPPTPTYISDGLTGDLGDTDARFEGY